MIRTIFSYPEEDPEKSVVIYKILSRKMTDGEINFSAYKHTKMIFNPQFSTTQHFSESVHFIFSIEQIQFSFGHHYSNSQL